MVAPFFFTKLHTNKTMYDPIQHFSREMVIALNGRDIPINVKLIDKYNDGIFNILNDWESPNNPVLLDLYANSIGSALTRILKGFPLTILTGDNEEWELLYDGTNRYVNKRCRSIVRHDKDGPIYFHKAIMFFDVDDHTSWYGTSAQVSSVQMIKMPFYPITFTCEIKQTSDLDYEVLNKEQLNAAYKYFRGESNYYKSQQR